MHQTCFLHPISSHPLIECYKHYYAKTVGKIHYNKVISVNISCVTHFLANSSSVSWNCFFKLSFSYKYNKSNQHFKLNRKTINIHWLFTNSSDSFRFRGVELGGSGQTNLVTLPVCGILKKKIIVHLPLKKKVEPHSLEKLGLLSINLGTQSPPPWKITYCTYSYDLVDLLLWLREPLCELWSYTMNIFSFSFSQFFQLVNLTVL